MYDNLRIAVLGGINKGKYAKQEEKQKKYFSIKNHSKQLNTAEKMALTLDNGESVLENTIKTLLEVTPDVSVIGHPPYLELNTTSKYNIIPQTGKSQLDSIEQAIVNIYKDGFKGDGLVICGDVPAIEKKDITSFIDHAQKKNKDIIMGLSDIAEIRKLGTPNKGGIRAYDSEGEFCNYNPKLTYGNIFLLSPKIYEQLDEVKKTLEPLLHIKKLFREPENYHKILEYFKDENKTVTANPTTKAGLLFNVMKYSNVLTRLFFNNFICKGKVPNPVTLPELNAFAQKKLFDDKLTFAFSYSSPRLGIDVDDEKDVEVVNKIMKK